LKRAKMLCTSCKTCSLACPFGVIFIDNLAYLDSHCNVCITKNTTCIETCPLHAIEVKEIEKESIEENIYFISDNLAVKHPKKWHLDDTVLFKKR